MKKHMRSIWRMNLPGQLCLALGIAVLASAGLPASGTLYRITGGSAAMQITNGMANSIAVFDAYFDESVTRAQCLANPAPGNLPFVMNASVVSLTDTIRPYGVVPSPFPGTPGSTRSPQKNTLVIDSDDVIGSWSLSNDSFGFTGNSILGEQIALTGMQRWTGPFTGVLVYGDFALRRSSATRFALTSNIDFLNAEWADITSPTILVSSNTLTISGDLKIGEALFLLDSTAVPGTVFGGFTLTATIEAVPAPAIGYLALNGGSATLQATNGLPGSGYTVLSTTNLALPVAAWNVVATNVIAADGNATNSISIPAGESAHYFRLKQP